MLYYLVRNSVVKNHQKKIFPTFPRSLSSPNVASWPCDFAMKFCGENPTEEMFSHDGTIPSLAFQMSLNK